jgi:hypothetical protein
MTNSQPHFKPSQKQLRYVKGLCLATGESVTYPKTRTEASAEIRRLLARKRLTPPERRREAVEIGAPEERSGDAAAVRPEEISGYGSSARWR